MTTSATTGTFARLKTWAKPTLSPEHGAYIVLGVSFILGAARVLIMVWQGLGQHRF